MFSYFDVELQKLQHYTTEKQVGPIRASINGKLQFIPLVKRENMKLLIPFMVFLTCVVLGTSTARANP